MAAMELAPGVGDSEGGGFFDRANDAAPMGGLDVRRKPLQDSPTPGANKAAHRSGIVGSIEEAATLGVAKPGDGEAHGPLGGGKITMVQSGLEGVEERGRTENLVVKRPFETRAARAMRKTARFVPGLGEQPVERLQGKGAAIVAA